MSLALVPLLATLGPITAMALLCGVVLAETALPLGFFLPGDSLLFAAGLLSATGALPVPVLLVVAAVWAAAVLGDQIGFLTGRYTGTRFLRRRRPLLWVRHVDAAESFFDRHGARTVVLARFVPAARTFTPFVAGAARMSHRRFTTYNVGGGLVWSAVMVLGGFYLGGVPFVASHVELTTLAIIAVSIAPATLAAFRAWRARRHGAEQPALDDASDQREHVTTS